MYANDAIGQIRWDSPIALSESQSVQMLSTSVAELDLQGLQVRSTLRRSPSSAAQGLRILSAFQMDSGRRSR